MIQINRGLTVDYSPEEARQILDWLLGSISEDKRRKARRAFLERITEIHRSAGVEPPGWLALLLGED